MPDVTPMFPLAAPLLPGMPLPLRLFEPRYLAMLQDVLERDDVDFGVVLIERGSEVGGGEARFGVGTMARIEQLAADDGHRLLLARGTGRFRVDRWLPDDPYPRAEVTPLDPLGWDPAWESRLAEAEDTVRGHLARAAEFVELRWRSDVELDDDPVVRCWQLAGIALLGPLDQVGLLRADDVGTLLDGVVEGSAAALETIAFGRA